MDYVSQLSCVRYYVVVKSSLNILVRNVSPRGPMCFRCLIFRLSGPSSCYFCFVLLPLGQVVSVVYPCMFYVLHVCFLVVGEYLSVLL